MDSAASLPQQLRQAADDIAKYGVTYKDLALLRSAADALKRLISERNGWGDRAQEAEARLERAERQLAEADAVIAANDLMLDRADKTYWRWAKEAEERHASRQGAPQTQAREP